MCSEISILSKNLYVISFEERGRIFPQHFISVYNLAKLFKWILVAFFLIGAPLLDQLEYCAYINC